MGDVELTTDYLDMPLVICYSLIVSAVEGVLKDERNEALHALLISRILIGEFL